jgi:hypothetical protein
MDASQVIVTLSGIALIAITIWFFFGKKPRTDRRNRYSCPMHPWITSADPSAVCSICGMKLVESAGPVSRV